MKLKDSIKTILADRIEQGKILSISLYDKTAAVAARVMAQAGSSEREKRRVLILFFAGLFILDYCMFCFHTDKNVFDIFPTFPKLDDRREVTLYLPSPDGKTIFPEKRNIPEFDTDEKLARYLFNAVARGSANENTAMVVPVEFFVRTVWMYGAGEAKKTCVIDVEPTVLDARAPQIAGSEDLFRQALEKTILKNMSRVGTVMLLEKGIPGARLWEL